MRKAIFLSAFMILSLIAFFVPAALDKTTWTPADIAEFWLAARPLLVFMVVVGIFFLAVSTARVYKKKP